jgi:uncharacterized protein (DUF1810 family)
MKTDLNRFLNAQEKDFENALAEIKSGKKESHWMWYIFPQIKGLGYSQMSIYYSIQNIKEAKDYLNHPILGSRLKEITLEVLALNENNATRVFGIPDNLKLKSSMTLFASVDTSTDKIFEKVLQNFFKGQFDEKTIDLLKNSKK